MTGEHDIIERDKAAALCRCGEWFESYGAHLNHFGLAMARAALAAGSSLGTDAERDANLAEGATFLDERN